MSSSLACFMKRRSRGRRPHKLRACAAASTCYMYVLRACFEEDKTRAENKKQKLSAAAPTKALIDACYIARLREPARTELPIALLHRGQQPGALKPLQQAVLPLPCRRLCLQCNRWQLRVRWAICPTEGR
mmetsp:Transcript_68513/g.135741  ORF Transcript_68513/g.135741 Transcript_68513/m.135741 type:complete len:130 (+) Transcript_68513:522-911(+)